jgi:ABC-type bacteriocin/lantibiotic exporter with double-glycine peptidase domain
VTTFEQVKVSMNRIQKLVELPDRLDTPPLPGLLSGEVKFDQCTASYKEKAFHTKVVESLRKNDLDKSKPDDKTYNGNKYYLK